MQRFNNGDATWLDMSATQKIETQRHNFIPSSWGLVIYRCTYDDNDAWSRFMEIVRRRAHDGLQKENAVELEQSLELTVVEDRDTLNQVSADDVRDRFRTWCSETFPQVNAVLHLGDLYPTPRFNFCIMVDEESLRAVLQGPPPGQPDLEGIGYVIIVHARWGYEPPIREDEKGIQPGECTSDDYDLGYLRVCLYTLIPEIYSWLATEDLWDVMYRRPPFVFVE